MSGVIAAKQILAMWASGVSNRLETYRSAKLGCAATRHTVENAGSGLIVQAVRIELCHGAQGMPAKAPLDPNRHLPEDIQYEGEALFRIVRSRDPLLSLWSEWN